MANRGSTQPVGAPIYLIETTEVWPNSPYHDAHTRVMTKVVTSRAGMKAAIAAIRQDMGFHYKKTSYRVFQIDKPQWEEIGAEA